MIPLLLVIIAIESYIFGGLNGAIIVSKFLYRKDIRKYGSGNAGLTNFYRTFGFPGIPLVLLVDIGKSVIPIIIGKLILGTQDAAQIGGLFAGFCAMLGHVYPIFYGFKGGKGVLCGCVVAFMARWWVGALCLLAFFIVVIFTRYVSLGSMVGGMMCAPLLWIGGFGGLEGFLGLLCGLLIVFEHRSNISRLLSHTEPKFGAKHPEDRIHDSGF